MGARVAFALALLVLGSAPAAADDDGWPDLSAFLDKKYGFLPIVIPITEPAVGFGAAGGLAFIDKSFGAATEFDRPNITVVGGLGTANGTWGAFGGDYRHWLDGRLQTVMGAVYASANLDFFGVGDDSALDDNPLRFTLEPKGISLQAKRRLRESRWWAGLGYAFARVGVSFEAPAGTPGIPSFDEESDIGALSPSLTYDSRDNFFTPTRGVYVEGSVGLFDDAFGGDDQFQRARVIGMQFFPFTRTVFFGYRGEVAAAFSDPPFYLEPFLTLRGAPILRYQGEVIAQLETELCWQFYKRLSVVGFVGYGGTWSDVEGVDGTLTVLTGGTGMRYELARRYGLHVGADVAFGPDETAVYIQFGSAWARP